MHDCPQAVLPECHTLCLHSACWAQGLTALEWQRAHAAALAAHGGAEMFELMGKRTCMLVRVSH